MVARAVSPTSAATSTKFAAATMRDITAAAPTPASDDSSARAEVTERDRCLPGCDVGRAISAARRTIHETRPDQSGAVFDLSGTTPQRPDLSGHCRGRDGLRVRPAA